ncbi:MAG: SpoVR family protein [Minisyncoccia bacterium]|jgi:spore cortex formation protein SpoVR/YcgB (stage V sporulation)
MLSLKIEDIKKIEDICRNKGLDFLDIEWIITSNEEMAEDICGVVPNDISYWQDGLNYWEQIKYNRRWENPYVYGVLEVIFDLGNKAIAYVRNDMDFYEQLAVVIHAIAHAHVFKNNYMRKLYLDNIKKYSQNTPIYNKVLSSYEEKYGFELIEAIEDLAFYLAFYTFDFKNPEYITEPMKNFLQYKENEDVIISSEKSSIDLSSFPNQNIFDILEFFIEHFPNLPQFIIDVFDIFKQRMLYIKSISKIKFVHEGFASFIENKIYPEIIQYFKTDNLKGYLTSRTQHYIFNSIDTERNFLINIIKIITDKEYFTIDDVKKVQAGEYDAGYYSLANLFEYLLSIFVTILSDPYIFGYYYFKYQSEKNGEDPLKLSSRISDEDIFNFVNPDFISYIFEQTTMIEKMEGVFIDEFCNFYKNYYRKYQKPIIYLPKGGIDFNGSTIKLAVIEPPYEERYYYYFKNIAQKIKNNKVLLKIKIKDIYTKSIFENVELRQILVLAPLLNDAFDNFIKRQYIKLESNNEEEFKKKLGDLFGKLNFKVVFSSENKTQLQLW